MSSDIERIRLLWLLPQLAKLSVNNRVWPDPGTVLHHASLRFFDPFLSPAARLPQALMQRPERHIALVTHSTWLHFTLSQFGRDHGRQHTDYIRWFENCEMRSLVSIMTCLLQ